MISAVPVVELVFPNNQNNSKTLVKVLENSSHKKGLDLMLCIQIDPQHNRPYIVLWKDCEGNVKRHSDSDSLEEAAAFYWDRVYAFQGQDDLRRQQCELNLDYLARISRG